MLSESKYLTDSELQRWFKGKVCLALIPVDHVDQQFTILRNDILNNLFPEVVSANHMKACKNFHFFQLLCGIVMIMMMNKVIDEVVIVDLLNITCEICGQLRGKKGYKIHLAGCRKKSCKNSGTSR
jgi:hypothetical protein